jgi:hypothetical protein
MITRHGYDIYVQLFSRIVFVDTHFYCVKTGIRVVSSIRALRNWAVGPTGPDSSDRIAGFGSALDSGVDPTLSHALEREMLRNYTNGSGPHGWGPGPDPAYAFPDPYGWVLVLHMFSSNPRTRISDLAAWHLDPNRWDPSFQASVHPWFPLFARAGVWCRHVAHMHVAGAFA